MAEAKWVWMCGERVVPQVVVDAIKRKFTPDMTKFEQIMKELGYDGLNGCFYFIHAGMFHGVEEKDGYIHT